MAAAPRWPARPVRAARAGRRPSRRAGRACTRGGRAVEPADGPHREGSARPGVTDVGRRPDRSMRGPDALQPLCAPGKVADQPGPGHDREEQGEHERDDEDELLELRAEIGERLAGAGEGARGRGRSPGSRRPADRTSEPPRSRPLWIIVRPPAGTIRPASAKLERNWKSCQTTIAQNTTHTRVVTSAISSVDRATGLHFRARSSWALPLSILRPWASTPRQTPVAGRVRGTSGRPGLDGLGQPDWPVMEGHDRWWESG